MNGKQCKKLRRLAELVADGHNVSIDTVYVIRERLTLYGKKEQVVMIPCIRKVCKHLKKNFKKVAHYEKPRAIHDTATLATGAKL